MARRIPAPHPCGAVAPIRCRRMGEPATRLQLPYRHDKHKGPDFAAEPFVFVWWWEDAKSQTVLFQEYLGTYPD
jgi:hypothetical protein